MRKTKQISWPRRATNHGYDCFDHEPIESWQPDDPLGVDCWIEVYLSPDGEIENNDRFGFRVVPPSVISELKGPENKKHLVVLPHCSWSSVEAEVEIILAKCKGNSLPEICAKLGEYFLREYKGRWKKDERP